MSLVSGSNVYGTFPFDIYDPFHAAYPFDALFSDDDLLTDFGAGDNSVFAYAKIDWKETPEAQVFKADIPGIKKEEVTVALEEGNVLRISGERSKEEEEKCDKWHRVERSSGKFLRRFRLPMDANNDDVKASMVNSVLTVIVPKVEMKSPEVMTIKISG